MYKVLAKPIPEGISAALEVAEMDALDKEEKESGQMAFAALLYQYGAQIDAKVLLLLWSIGIMTPRLMKLAKDKAEKKTKRPIEERKAA